MSGIDERPMNIDTILEELDELDGPVTEATPTRRRLTDYRRRRRRVRVRERRPRRVRYVMDAFIALNMFLMFVMVHTIILPEILVLMIGNLPIMSFIYFLIYGNSLIVAWIAVIKLKDFVLGRGRVRR